MKCIYCNDTGEYKMPKDQEMFYKIIDEETEKAYFVNYIIAEQRAYNKVGYTLIDCPYCKK